jgi:hypothetical protein
MVGCGITPTSVRVIISIARRMGIKSSLNVGMMMKRWSRSPPLDVLGERYLTGGERHIMSE